MRIFFLVYEHYNNKSFNATIIVSFESIIVFKGNLIIKSPENPDQKLFSEGRL